MIRPFDALLIGLVVVGAVWTYRIKHEAEAAADRVSGLQRQIAAERERIMFLRADWSYLGSPVRLEALVERFGDDLKLEPIKATQIVEPFDLPAADVPETEIAADAGEITTGSVERPSGVPKPRAPGPTVVPMSIDDILKKEAGR